MKKKEKKKKKKKICPFVRQISVKNIGHGFFDEIMQVAKIN